MKRIFTMFLVAVLGLSLVACGKKTYEVDGVFTAFEVSYNREVPMITWVDVTIKDGELESIYIDALQATVNDEGKFVWNEKSKKELGPDYNMLPASEIEKEWFEQAATLEAYMLENGADAVTKDEDGYIDNVTGVSVKDGGYTKLTKEALENAKNRVFLDFELGITNQNGPQVTWAEVTVNKKGETTKVFLDSRQSTKTVADDKTTFSWNEKTKKQLEFDYGMLPASEIEKEWFEQAAALETYILENGVNAVTKNSDGYIDNVTGVSVKDAYTGVVKGAIAKIAK